MMKKNNLLLRIVAMVVMTVTVLTANAQNVGDQFTENGIKYEVTSVSPNKVKVIVDGYYSNLGDVDIPASVTYNGLECAVTEIDNNAFRDADITSVYIPNSVTKIGYYAFAYCEKLTSVTIGNSVTNIGDWAFANCESLTLIISNIENVGSVTMGYEVFEDTDKVICLLAVPEGKVTEYNITGQWGGFPTVEKTEINDEFTDNDIKYKVTSIHPDEVKVIENNYSGDFTIPASASYHHVEYNVTEIGNAAFFNCADLTSVTIGSKVTTIANNAFNNCTGLTTFNVDTENTAYSSEAGVLFNKDKTALKLYPLGKTDTKYTIPNSVTNIETCAFYQCADLTSVTIGSAVTNIGNSAFYQCSNLTSITSKIENIGNVTVESSVFDGVNRTNCTLIVPKGKVGEYQGIAPWSSFGTITEIVELNDEFIDNDIKYKVISLEPNQVEVIANTKKNAHGFLVSSYAGTIDIPTNVTKNTLDFSVIRVGNKAFQNCSGLTSVTIPNSVDSIASSAFYNCSGLTSIEIPNSVRGIGSAAFIRCTGLTSVTIPSSVQAIGMNAFFGCSGITYVRISGTTTGDAAFKNLDNLETLIIDNSVTTIGEGSFLGCKKLTSVTIPSSVTAIEDYAFYYSTNLTSITSKIENIGSVTMGDEGVFNGITLSNCTLNVPKGKVGEYQGLSPWNRFGTIREIVEVGDQFTENNIKYEITSLDPKKVKVIANNPKYTGEITIPASVTYNGGEYAVTEIGEDAFDGCTGLTAITIPNSVITIGNGAFSSCMGLTSIEIPNSVTTIEAVAFSSCQNLTSLTIGNSVTSFGWGVFDNCIKLTSITSKIENISSVTMGGSLFNGVNKTTCTLTVPKEKANDYKGASQWSDFNTIVEVVNVGESFIVDNVKYEITSVTPKKVKVILKITMGTIYQYSGDITIPATVTNKDIEFAVTGVDEDAFAGSTGLTAINVDAENTAYSSENGVLFNKDKTTLITYPAGKVDTDYTISNSVTAIGNYAFRNCTNLTTVTIGSAVANIGNNAFAQCTGLTSISSKIAKIGNVVMGSNVFDGVSTTNCTIKAPKGKKAEYQGASQWNAFTIIEDVNVEDTFTEANNVMYEVTSLNPNTVKVISNEDNDPSGDITIPATITYNGKDFSVTEIGEFAFQEIEGLTSITIPQSVTNISRAVFAMCSDLTAINVDNNNTAYSSENGILFNKDKTTLVAYPVGKADTNYDIPNSVDTIGYAAFATCQNLTSVTIGSTVETIEGYAFYMSSGLTSVTIPNSVETIGDNAFRHCENLTTATIGNSVTEIGNGAFANTGLTEVIIPNSVETLGESAFYQCANLTSVTIGNSVTEIGGEAFAGTGLTEAIIPNSVETIGYGAFSGCESLTSVTIGNSVTEIEGEAFANCSKLNSITSKIENIGGVTMGDDVFDEVDKTNCTLKVPEGKVAEYQGADQWSEFTNVVENTSTGICHATVLRNPISIVGNNITISKVAGKNVKLYSLSGQVLCNLHATQDDITLSVNKTGTYILQVENATRKIVVK